MDTIYNDILDIHFKENLLKKIQVYFKDELVEQGKLIAYKQDVYNVCFVIDTLKKDGDDFYLPIPFNIENDKINKIIRFDYKLKTFCKNNKESYNILIELLRKYNPNEYLDNVVEIKVL